MFLRRKSRLSLAEMESQFTDADNRRQREFNDSLSLYGQSFRDEERAQRAGEQQRNEEFNQMTASLDAVIEVVLEKWDKAFRDDEVRHEATFQEHESIRAKRFSEVESDRAVHFLKYQHTNDQRAEWYTKIRESLLQRGRQEREEACKQLEKDMQDQLERLLRWQQECFASAEKRRDDIVREIVANGNFPRTSTRRNGVIYATSDISDADEIFVTVFDRAETSVSPPQPPTDLLSSNDSQTFVEWDNPISVRPMAPSTILVGSSSASPSHLPPSPQWSPARLPSTRTGGMENGVAKSLPEDDRSWARPVRVPSAPRDDFEEPFEWNEEKRQSEYVQEEGQRGVRFSRAEIAGDDSAYTALSPFPTRSSRASPFHPPPGAQSSPARMTSPVTIKKENDAARTMPQDDQFKPSHTPSMSPDDFEERFKMNEEKRQQEFLQEEGQRDELFTQAEIARNEAETARTTVFEQRAANRDQMFQAVMSMHRKSFQRWEAFRDRREEWRTQESQVAEKNRTQSFDQSLVSIREQYHVLEALEVDALASMKRRIAKVDALHQILLEKGRQQRHVTFSLSQARRELELQVPALEFEEKADHEPKTEGRSRLDDKMSMPQLRMPVPPAQAAVPPFVIPSGRRLSPATGIDVGVLRPRSSLLGPLPIPGTGEHLSGENLHRSRRQLFEKAQAHREMVFQQGIQTRRRKFNANEAKREAAFEALQRTRKETAVQQEHRRYIAFVNAQDKRQTAFQDAEIARESTFHTAQRQRAEAYIAAQARRDAEFRLTQDELQNNCLKSDVRWTSGFEEWASQLLRGHGENQLEGYKREEREREARFARAVDTSALKNRRT